MDNWGAFIFFAGWCFVSLIHVFLAVPKTAGLPVEHFDALFEGPWWEIRSKTKKVRATIAAQVIDEEKKPASAHRMPN
ncbi:hypothetical protein QQZ08_008342 [Neonectria magnoliae]|uniref:Uncharacterized protein n=1 Tax=Neonectria magnoliae TaxID=2732573 RepID=A0ABR1HVJ9_9HYPO